MLQLGVSIPMGLKFFITTVMEQRGPALGLQSRIKTKSEIGKIFAETFSEV